MKKIRLLIAVLSASLCATGQTPERIFTYATAIGTGIALNEPSVASLTWQVSGYYNIGKRFSAGVGTGLSCYKTTLIPVFADVKFALTQPQRFTPFVECTGGYAFAPGKNANGGICFNPAIGLQYALPCQKKLQLAAGYGLQQAERLKEFENEYFVAGFMEKLTHHSLTVRIGILF